jgi:hypothetical protein
MSGAHCSRARALAFRKNHRNKGASNALNNFLLKVNASLRLTLIDAILRKIPKHRNPQYAA